MSEVLMYATGKEMKFEPVNRPSAQVLRLIKTGVPQVVILEPGDATRYMLLIVPLINMEAGNHIRDIGIPFSEAANYIFVSKLSREECQGTWIQVGENQQVGVWSTAPLSPNTWSQKLLAWWFTTLYSVPASVPQ